MTFAPSSRAASRFPGLIPVPAPVTMATFPPIAEHTSPLQGDRVGGQSLGSIGLDAKHLLAGFLGQIENPSDLRWRRGRMSSPVYNRFRNRIVVNPRSKDSEEFSYVSFSP